MSRFAFATTPALDVYFAKVVDVLRADLGISEDEAVGRINRTFENHEVIGDKLLMHEWAKDTAYQLYYGPNQLYWKTGAVLTPLPYP